MEAIHFQRVHLREMGAANERSRGRRSSCDSGNRGRPQRSLHGAVTEDARGGEAERKDSLPQSPGLHDEAIVQADERSARRRLICSRCLTKRRKKLSVARVCSA